MHHHQPHHNMSPSGRRYEHLLEKQQHYDMHLAPHDHGMYPLEQQQQVSEDDCGLFNERPKERFIFVGECRGHYEESRRGNFHYVGPNRGHFEKELLPPKRTWQRVLFISFFAIVLIVATAVLVSKFLLTSEPAFDCMAGLRNAAAGWSELKREYCCEEERLGCEVPMAGEMVQGATVPGETVPGPTVPGETTDPTLGESVPGETEPGETVPGLGEPIPLWLDWWLADAALGMKFTISALLALMLGCCCGVCSYYQWLLKYAPTPRSATEAELALEIKKLLKRAGAKTGELAVSLMWDTVDDLDLHLKLPDCKGEISAEHPEAYGGKLDVDGNHILEMASMKPIENITWPDYHPAQRNHPPIGRYGVYVKVFGRRQHIRDINITVALSVSGHTELFHQRIMPGVSEVMVCNFDYEGPAESPRHSHTHSHTSAHAHSGGSRTRPPARSDMHHR
mmetsp:Transcript_14447/g.36500  ORF Transcript_14447/g.36500 Transcript_14447/m.36500 type:complete len:452 (-) Transcript_14447:261-1616(-)